MKKVHIGEVVKSKVEEKKISYSAFAKSLNIQRQNIDKTVFSKASLDAEILIRISENLDFNFFQYYVPEGEEETCNKKDYTPKEIKATLTIELGQEKKDQVFRFIFGDNDVKILNK